MIFPTLYCDASFRQEAHRTPGIPCASFGAVLINPGRTDSPNPRRREPKLFESAGLTTAETIEEAEVMAVVRSVHQARVLWPHDRRLMIVTDSRYTVDLLRRELRPSNARAFNIGVDLLHWADAAGVTLATFHVRGHDSVSPNDPDAAYNRRAHRLAYECLRRAHMEAPLADEA